jgi:hypothetical protein
VRSSFHVPIQQLHRWHAAWPMQSRAAINDVVRYLILSLILKSPDVLELVFKTIGQRLNQLQPRLRPISK